MFINICFSLALLHIVGVVHVLLYVMCHAVCVTLRCLAFHIQAL